MDLYRFQGQKPCPVTQLAGIVVAPAPDGAVFFQCEGMMGAGRDFDSVGKYRTGVVQFRLFFPSPARCHMPRRYRHF